MVVEVVGVRDDEPISGRRDHGRLKALEADMIANDLVREAEATVCHAWAARLIAVREEAENGLNFGMEIRGELHERLQELRRRGADARRIADMESELAAAELVTAQYTEESVVVNGYVARELHALEAARTGRFRASIAEKRRLRDARLNAPDAPDGL
jgi:hypothetical protein